MQKITPFLWFNGNAEEAVQFYISVFRDGRLLSTSRYPEGSPGPAGQLMTAHFQLHGQEFIALNGGPEFKFTEAVSFVVDCKDQEDVDYFWNKLSEGGQPSMCGWLKDRFGLSWQVVPSRLPELMQHPDKEKARRVMMKMLGMQKINIRELEEA
jgi:predicted 3-demethylubiquinone-9 3-methyltransferase (glyoxalase superfamily)